MSTEPSLPAREVGAAELDTSHSSVLGGSTRTPKAHPEETRPRYATGAMLGKYAITGFLGRGGMGEVYQAFDPLIERPVALKVLPESLARSPQALNRFLAEARAVGKLTHPQVVALHEIGQHEGSFFLAMEFVGSGSVLSLIQKLGRLPWLQATRFLAEMCEGLGAAHSVGLIHRDIKPENLLRTTDDHIKISDFGLAKISAELATPSLSLTNPGELLGTPYYMSPEQFNGSHVESRSDIYSVGASYYHMLTGRPPFASSQNLVQVMFSHCQGEVPDPRVAVPEVPEACAEIVRRAMAKVPQDRFATAHELAEAALAILYPPSQSSGPMPSSLRHSMASNTRPRGVQALSPMIWILEPSRMQATLLQKNLTALGVTDSPVFSTLAQTYAALQSARPRAIISAMHLDDGSGDDLVAVLRTLPAADSMFVFIISSDAAANDPGSYYPGRPLILPKPVTREMLSEILRRISTPAH